MPDIVGILSPKPVRLFVHRLHRFFCLFFSFKETHWGIFFKLYPVNLSTDFVWILITEDPVHTLSSGSFKLFLKTHDQASSNFFLILHWVTLDKDIGIHLNQKNFLCLPHQVLCAKHFLIMHSVKPKINCTEERQRKSSPRHALSSISILILTLWAISFVFLFLPILHIWWKGTKACLNLPSHLLFLGMNLLVWIYIALERCFLGRGNTCVWLEAEWECIWAFQYLRDVNLGPWSQEVDQT